MKVLIAVPSKARAVHLNTHTMSWLQFVKRDYFIFVEPQEADLYNSVFPEKVIKLPDNNQGLGFSKEYIQRFAQANKYDLIFKLDDDLMGWVGKERGPAKRGKAAAEVFESLLNDCIKAFEQHEDVKGIGFPYKNEMWEVKKWTGVNARLQTCYITRTEWFFGDKNLSTFEDFATYLIIRVKNGLTLRYGWAGMDCEKVGVNQGGHQSFDRNKQALKEFELLRNIYPPLKAKAVTGKAWSIEPDFHDKLFAGKGL